MYLYACNQTRARERERDKSLECNLIALKNVVICLHDPIILCLVNRF